MAKDAKGHGSNGSGYAQRMSKQFGKPLLPSLSEVPLGKLVPGEFGGNGAAHVAALAAQHGVPFDHLSPDGQTVWRNGFGTPNWAHPAVQARFDRNSDESRQDRIEKHISGTRR